MGVTARWASARCVRSDVGGRRRVGEWCRWGGCGLGCLFASSLVDLADERWIEAKFGRQCIEIGALGGRVGRDGDQ